MQKIIVNGRFLIHRVTGVERYAREILLELDKLVSPETIKIAIPPEADNVPEYQNIDVIKIGKLSNRLWEHISFPAYVRKQKGISLNLCNVAPLTSPGIVAIFDMKVREHPEFFSKQFVFWYRLLFSNETKRAKLIFTDSNSAKADILRYYKIPADKIVVAPCAWQHYEHVGFDEKATYKYGLQKNEYYFAMGSLDPNKNFQWIAEVARNNPEQDFAVAGSINKAVFSEGLGFECPENMKLLGYVSDEEAKTLMRDCRAFLFPSFCEGFGMPPLEALSAGTKTIVVSDIPVMHELFEDGAYYINPADSRIDLTALNQISDQTRKFVLDKYSWSKTARIVYQQIQRLT